MLNNNRAMNIPMDPKVHRWKCQRVTNIFLAFCALVLMLAYFYYGLYISYIMLVPAPWHLIFPVYNIIAQLDSGMYPRVKPYKACITSMVFSFLNISICSFCLTYAALQMSFISNSYYYDDIV